MSQILQGSGFVIETLSVSYVGRLVTRPDSTLDNLLSKCARLGQKAGLFDVTQPDGADISHASFIFFEVS